LEVGEIRTGISAHLRHGERRPDVDHGLHGLVQPKATAFTVGQENA